MCLVHQIQSPCPLRHHPTEEVIAQMKTEGTFTTLAVAAGVALSTGALPVAAQDFPAGDVAFTIWTKDGEADGRLQFVQRLAVELPAAHPNVTIAVVKKDGRGTPGGLPDRELRREPGGVAEDGGRPRRTVHSRDLLLPMDGLFDAATYLPNASPRGSRRTGQTWGVPILLWQPADALLQREMGGAYVSGRQCRLGAAADTCRDWRGQVRHGVNQTESFWLVPFLGGFGGSASSWRMASRRTSSRGDGRRPGLPARAQVHQGRARPKPITTSPTGCSRIRRPR